MYVVPDPKRHNNVPQRPPSPEVIPLQDINNENGAPAKGGKVKFKGRELTPAEAEIQRHLAGHGRDKKRGFWWEMIMFVWDIDWKAREAKKRKSIA
jgi:hypothetical protein